MKVQIERIRVFLVDLPHDIKGFCTKNTDDSYTMLINARLNSETQTATYDHEIAHIENGDYDTSINVGSIESIRHAV